MSLTPDTPVTVTLTMKQLYAACAALVALFGGIIVGVWVVTTSTVGDIRKDVTEIRKGLQDNVKGTNDVNLGLTKEIAGLRGDFGTLSIRIQNLDASITKFEAQLRSIQTAWADPKAADSFAANLRDRLKSMGTDSDRIVIVPFTPYR